MEWIKLTTKQKELIAEKLMDLANLAFAGLVLGQFVEKKLDITRNVMGIVSLCGLYVCALLITKKKGRRKRS